MTKYGIASKILVDFERKKVVIGTIAAGLAADAPDLAEVEGAFDMLGALVAREDNVANALALEAAMGGLDRVVRARREYARRADHGYIGTSLRAARGEDV